MARASWTPFIPEASAFKVSLACRQPVTCYAPHSKAALLVSQLGVRLSSEFVREPGAERRLMASTRNALASIEEHVLESMGSRADGQQPRLAPIPHPRTSDDGRSTASAAWTLTRLFLTPHSLGRTFLRSHWPVWRIAFVTKGQLAPIRVRWSDELGKWVIIAGERRWRATKLAGLPTIECYFHAGELSRAETLEQQLIENLLREDLKPIEEAKAFQSLMNLNGWNGKQVAQTLHVPPPT